MTDIDSIARQLSEAQRRALVGDLRSIGDPERFVLTGEILEKRMVPTLLVLTKLGLIEEGRFGKTMLTPLGVAVRNHILGEKA